MSLSATVADQYRAVLEKAGLIDLSWRAKVAATGPDRVSFLHAMISNDLEQLPENAGCYATLLTANGRIVADFYCYKLPDQILLDVQGDSSGKLITTLEKFIIMDDVTLEDVTGRWSHIALQGPRALELFRETTGVTAPPQPLQLCSFESDGCSCLVIRKGSLHDVGLEVVGWPPGVDRMKRDLLGREEVEGVGPEALDLLRLERGIPLYGVDMDETNYPMEARLEAAISLTKGCYIGQEVVAKATHIGGVNRLLCRLLLPPGPVPPGRAAIWAGEKKVGFVTSAATSPRLQRPIALAYLRRAFSGAGQVVEVELSEGGKARAEVVEDFGLN